MSTTATTTTPTYSYSLLIPNPSEIRKLDSDALQVQVRFVKIDSQTGEMTNPRADEDAFADLTFSCYVSLRAGEVGITYGWHLEYLRVFSIDLEHSERMTKMLRRIESNRAKLPVRPETFGQFVALTSAALKVTSAKRLYESKGWSYGDSTYTTFTGADIADVIDAAVRAAVELNSEKEVA